MWSLNNLEQLRVAWRKTLRGLWNVSQETQFRVIALLSESAHLSIQPKACFVKFICEALEHDNSTLKYITKLDCQNPMSVSGRNWCDCVSLSKDISMIGMNVMQVYSEW